VLCLGWFALIRTYNVLSTARFAVVHELERRLPARPFDLEWHHVQHGTSRRYTPVTHVEQLVPGVFAAIYIGLIVIATIVR
jgi:hypothetical protein